MQTRGVPGNADKFPDVWHAGYPLRDTDDPLSIRAFTTPLDAGSALLRNDGRSTRTAWMNKVRVYSSFLDDFKRKPRNARQLRDAIGHFEQSLLSLATGAPMPRETPARSLDPEDERDRQRIQAVKVRAARGDAYDFESVSDAVAWLKKECGLAH